MFRPCVRQGRQPGKWMEWRTEPAPKPLQDGQMSEFVTPSTLMSHRASQHSIETSCTGSLSLSPKFLCSPRAELQFPELLAQIYSSPRLPLSFVFVNTSKDFQLSTPKPSISCTPEPLIASVSHLLLPLPLKYLPIWLCIHSL